mgnify:CR=1 FL=1
MFLQIACTVLLQFFAFLMKNLVTQLLIDTGILDLAMHRVVRKNMKLKLLIVGSLVDNILHFAASINVSLVTEFPLEYKHSHLLLHIYIAYYTVYIISGILPV